MRSFATKFLICLIPCLLAGWVTSVAVARYVNGEPGGFKFGVDLVGGTILVYEIDMKKKAETDKAEQPKDMTNLLAESLKRRIDPNDLYNIVIRPAGGEGRVEIVLPTGGVYRTEKAEEAWRELVAKMAETYGIDKNKLDVGRGKSEELADRIQLIKSERKWQEIFRDSKAWNMLLQDAYSLKTGEWRELIPEKVEPALKKVQPGDFDKLVEVLQKELDAVGTQATETNIRNWIKHEAWKQMLNRAAEKWTFLESHRDDLLRIPPDSNEQLISFINARGNVYTQAVITTLEPLLGNDVLTSKDFVSREQAKEFIEANYGPSLSDIRAAILEETRKTGRSRDLTVEEVQRIKELVAKVGSLEFRMLANSVDDAKAIEDAKAYMNDPANKTKLQDLQKEGLPPPGPREPNSEDLQKYTINLPRGYKSVLTYSWVELGPQERRSLNLDNGAETELNRAQTWNEAKLKRDLATLLKDPSAPNRFTLQGALFYSRECLNRNLPEEERRNKKIEYFVLARNPEIDPADPQQVKETPKIDGSYLVSATSGSGADLRPAVHFQFNAEGGRLFGQLTRKNVPSGSGPENDQIRRHLAIILDGLIMSAPTINSEITTHGQISGSFTQKEVDSLVNILRSGALPATLKPQPVSESTMGPTLGQDTIHAGVTAVVMAFLAVLVFMVIYYRFAGLVASIALLANLLLTIGFMVAVQATFTLPGLAGLVLMLGMAVDANVLIYERLREERERGASLALAIRNGYDRAFPTIIDTHLSSIFTAIVLYVVGNDQLKGFGVSLTVGLIISLFTSLFMTRLMFDYWLSRNWLHKLSMLRLFARPNIDFMSIRHVMFAATLLLALLGIGLFIGRLPNDLNIDFVGGTAYGGQLNKPLDMAELRSLIAEKRQHEVLGSVTAKEVEGSNGTRFTLAYANDRPRTITVVNRPDSDSPDDRAKVIQERASRLPDPSVEQIFPSFEKTEVANTSRYFTIRTSEKEPELVQAAIDRLLRTENNEPLLKKVYMWVPPNPFGEQNKSIRLRAYASEPPAGFDPASSNLEPEYASPSFVKTLLNRNLAEMFAGEKFPAFDVVGEGPSKEGRYQVMNVVLKSDVVTRLSEDQRAKFVQAIERTRDTFNQQPQPDRLENFDSQLATETRFRAMWAILASWGAILVYLWFRFGNWTFGLAAVICLIHDLFLTLGAIAACHYLDGTFLGNVLGLEDFKIDLPAVAALLTLVGYSVNDTIVVFDRIREVRGKNPDLTSRMINDSINQTLSRTVLASLTTWLVVFVLYVWGGPGVHLFAFVMVVGVLVGTYSSIYIASPLLLMFGEGIHDDAVPLERQTRTAGAV